MVAWRDWNLQAWNEQLLSHYFKRRPGDADTPVVALLATADELAAATGDAAADPFGVRGAFVKRVQDAISSSSLFDHASDYADWPAPPPEVRVPRFISHLIFTCIAASESSEELANEASYLKRLRDLCGSPIPDSTLQWLPTLWQNLAAWLNENARSYRQLRLPDQGSFARIGYSVRLAFPDRRDQMKLSDLLDAAGLLGQEPPVSKVIAIVAGARNEFTARKAFLEAFDDFRSSLAKHSLHSREVTEHRFWSAVRAATRGRKASDRVWAGSGAQFQILCEEQDERLNPFVVADASLPESTSVRALGLPVQFGPWHFAVVDAGNESATPLAAYDTARSLFAGERELPKLSALVHQGLVPFVPGDHGYLEVAGYDQLEGADTALARSDLVDEILRRFGRKDAKSRESRLAGWTELHGLALRRLTVEELDNTPLRNCWQLQDTVSKTRISFRGGVRAGDGWLGFREILPLVVCPDAIRLRIGQAGSDILSLERTDTEIGTWQLPEVDYTGEHEIAAEWADGSSERTHCRFNSISGAAVLRKPNEPQAWLSEAVGGTATLREEAPLTESPSQKVLMSVDRTVYLGPVVGQFVGGPEVAAWRISTFANTLTGVRCRHDLADETGFARVPEYSARRKWRRFLFNCKPGPLDADFRTVRSRIAQRAKSGSTPIVDVQAASLTPPRLGERVLIAKGVERLMTALAAQAANRTGIPYAGWLRMIQRFLGQTGPSARHITRSWSEAGILDVAYFARWSNCSVFARAPQFVVFPTSDGLGGTLLGAVQTTVYRDVLKAAKSHRVAIEERAGPSASTPQTLTLRFESIEQVHALSKASAVGWKWLDLEFDKYVAQCSQIGIDQPPLNYEEFSAWKRWSLFPGEHGYDEVHFENCRRRGRPDYWRVRCGAYSVWSYSLNTARIWASTFLGRPALEDMEGRGLTAIYAYLPLPLARALTVVEGAAPGIDHAGRYRYVAESQAISAGVCSAMEKAFDVGKLPQV
jgi:hypothetical protein